MATLVTRSGKGSPLTHAEVDANFTNLNTDKLELSGGTMTGNLSFGDNDKAIFGAGSDLQIWHDATNNSIIRDAGAGDLYIQASANLRLTNVGGAETYAIFTENGAATLYYDNAAKLATTSTGVDITGTLTSDALTVDGLAKIQGVSTGLLINETDTTDVDSYLTTSGGVFKIFTTNDAFSSFTERLRINHSTGDISFYEDTGTTAKFFWDASAESLGIGTSSPSHTISLESAYPYISFNETDQTPDQKWVIGGASGNFVIYDDTDSATRIAVDGSGNVGIGTATPQSSAGETSLTINGSTTGRLDLRGGGVQAGTISSSGSDMTVQTGYGKPLIIASGTTAYTQFKTNGVERMRIDSSGRLLLGTTTAGVGGADELTIAGSGATGITIRSGTTSTSNLYFADGTSGNAYYRGFVVYSHSTDHLALGSAGVERMRIDSSGNVGIGTSSPSSTLEVSKSDQTNGATLTITNAFSGGSWAVNDVIGTIDFKSDDTSSSQLVRGQIQSVTDNVLGSNWSYGTALTFSTAYNNTLSERMRIDSSGNLLVGTTDSTLYNNTSGSGLNLKPNGALYAALTTTDVWNLNLIGSDGNILNFRKNGSTVGSIGTRLGRLKVGYSDVGLFFDNSNDRINPEGPDNTGARDAAIDLGHSGGRFKDLYLSGGVYLGGTGSANKLDDYEEGTWTPAMGGSGSNPTVSYSARSGKYTKIGRIVHLNFYISISSYSGGSGLSIITGMPFGAVNEDAVYFYYGGGSSKSADKGAIQSSGRIVFGQDNVGGINFINCSDMNSGGGLIIGNVTYETS